MQGHGGGDPGATYQGRNEKDDTLRLVLAIGQILENNGVDVEYTRTTDVYQTPLRRRRSRTSRVRISLSPYTAIPVRGRISIQGSKV